MFPTILPKPTLQDHQDDPDADPPASKRKRSLVALACAACRKRKTKCDGRRPMCRPCEQRGIRCVFDFPEDVPAARRGKITIEKLSKVNFDLNNIIETLRSGTEEHAMAIVREIRANDTLQQRISNVEHLSAGVLTADGPDQSSIRADLTYSQLVTDPGSSQARFLRTDHDPRIRPSTAIWTEENSPSNQTGRYSSIVQSPHVTVDILPISKWTVVPGSDKEFSELLMLLWAWDTTFIRIIDREAFEADLRGAAGDVRMESPKRQFCSVFLLNALLGYACTYALDKSGFDRAEHSLSRGRLFVEQAEAQIEAKMLHPSFELLQGLAILYAYEARIGYGKVAKSHLERVFHIYKCLNFDEEEVSREIEASDLDAEQVRRAKSKILWGLYVFDWKMSHTYGQRKRLGKPSIRKTWQTAPCQPNQLDYWWCQWPKSLLARRSYFTEVFSAECSLIEIAEDILVYMYPNEQKEASALQDRAFQLYARLVEWKLNFSEAIPEDANEFPQSLHVSYCYEMLVVVVLRKVTHLTKEEFGIDIDPQSLCYMHTNNIISILWTYRALYTIRSECWAGHACSLVAFSTIFYLKSNTVLHDSFEKACRILYEISEVYPLALDFLFSIRVVVHENDIKVSKIASKYLSMANGPRQPELTTEWRALILLEKTDGVRGGNRDTTLGDLVKGFSGLATAEE